MEGKELIGIINRQLDTEFNGNISLQELREKLTFLLNDLIQNDFQKLVAILYKVDVDETKLKQILKDQAEKDAGTIIAELILEREIQKIETRRLYKS